MAFDIALAVDDAAFAEQAARVLSREGYEVGRAGEADYAEASLVVLRREAGVVETCVAMRHAGIASPLLVVNPDRGPETRIRTLDAGADDYLAEPFEWPEFAARVRALLRRSMQAAFHPVWIGSLQLDPLREAVSFNGRPVDFSAKEFQLLRYLLANQGRILSRDQLLADVWGYRATTTRTVDMHIAHIRRKLGLNPRRPKLILTIRGEGYLLKAGDLLASAAEAM